MGPHSVECPHCGAEHSDLWELGALRRDGGEDEIECDECGMSFLIIATHYDPTYEARKIEEPEED